MTAAKAEFKMILAAVEYLGFLEYNKLIKSFFLILVII
jgi:hypothetical protein